MKKATKSFLNRLQAIFSEPTKIVDICSKINQDKTDEILSAEQLEAIYAYILKTPDINKKIDQLEKNQSLRFAKNADKASPLPRTCVIQKFPDGHLELIVMPNRKLANGAKIPAKKQNGSKKKIKVAYRIDDERQENIYRARLSINLSIDIPGQEAMSLERVTNEASLSQHLSTSKYVSPIYTGTPYYHQANNKEIQSIYAFAALGICDLIDFKQALNNDELTAYNIPNQMPDFLKPLISSLLHGLLDMEQAQIVHIDIDFRNIILSRDNAANLIAKFIDFEKAIDLNKGPSKQFGGTHLVMAPDAFESGLEHASRMDSQHGKEHAIYMWNQIEGYGWNVYCEETKKGVEYPARVRSDFKDCCWSVGVIIFQLLTQRLPKLDEYTKTTIEKNTLLKGLLAPTREARFSAAEAVACWEQNPKLEFESRPAEQYTMREFLDAESRKKAEMLAENKRAHARAQSLQATIEKEMRGLQETLADMAKLMNMPQPPIVPALKLATSKKPPAPASSSQALAKSGTKEFSGLKKGFFG